jgi:hypothetical protein
MFVECSGVTGFRSLPFPGFDLLKETKELAAGGLAHSWSEDHQWFAQYAKSKLYMLPKKWNIRMGFREYIASGLWATSGSSSMGYMMIKYEKDSVEHEKRVKVRKNLVLDVITVDDLYTLCMSWDRQDNKVIVKSELGKVRLAVACDLPMYLQMAYVDYCAGDYYQGWPNVVSAESPAQQLTRMMEMLRLSLAMYGMPFDYKGFDHQPQTHELAAVEGVTMAVGRNNVDDLEEYDRICANIMYSWDRSFLTLTIPHNKDDDHSGHKQKQHNNSQKDEVTFKVTGGLNSGLKITSLASNACNTLYTNIACEFLQSLGYNLSEVQIFLKGDDTSFFAPRAEILQAIYKMYKAMNIQAGEGKFSILRRGNEFLRTWYSDRCYGYPGRLIPTLNQRKPWSNTPWTPLNVLEAQYKTVVTLRRRVIDQSRLNDWWQFLSTRWCHLHSIPAGAVSIPTRLGGMGLGTWDGKSCLYPHLPPMPKLKATPIISTTYRKDALLTLAAEYSLPISDTVAESIVLDQVKMSIQSDDLPISSKILRDSWNSERKSLHFKILPYKPSHTNLHVMLQPDLWNLDYFLSRRGSSYGTLSHETNIIQQVKPLLTANKISIKQFIFSHPQMAKLKAAYLSWKNPHMTAFLDWYGGNAPMQTHSLNPLLTQPYQQVLLTSTTPNRLRSHDLEWLFCYLAPRAEIILTATHFYTATCLW